MIRSMNIAMLAAGAGGMYCGSCMRDNSLARGLIRAGHAVTLVPLYTPMRTDEPVASIGQVFFGGVNVYLQHASRLFRHTPRWIDWLFDRPWLLRLAGRRAGSTDPRKLGPLTISVLEGEHGPTRKELIRLADFLAEHIHPDVICLPNAMFVGTANLLRRRLGVPVVCQLSGEDIFLDALPDSHRDRAWAIVRERSADIARFAAPSRYFAHVMTDRLRLSAERIDIVYPGVPIEPGWSGLQPQDRKSAPQVGYLARICPAKGFDCLLAALAPLIGRRGCASVEFRTAGWLAPLERKWFESVVAAHVTGPGLARAHVHLGEVDHTAKLAMLHSLNVFSVPARYAEPKGIYVLEALAAGVPVVQVDRGSFPELVAATGGGLIVPPDDPEALADGLAELIIDDDRRRALGQAGRAAVLAGFTDDHMAAAMLACFARACGPTQCPRPMIQDQETKPHDTIQNT